MKVQGTLALITAIAAFGWVGAATAQGLPPQVMPPVNGPPAYEAHGAYPGGAPPRYGRGESLPDDAALLPQEIIGILRSVGYSPLRAPARRGRFYVVAVLHPSGEDGRVTIDAISGRFVRFVPADRFGFVGAFRPYAPPALRDRWTQRK